MATPPPGPPPGQPPGQPGYPPPGQPPMGQNPGRGGLILTLGILGFCCLFFGIAAWVMGSGDLKKIERGEIDPSAKGLTQTGMILGIVTTILNVVGGIAQIVMQAGAQ